MKKKLSFGSIFLYFVIFIFVAAFLFITVDGANNISSVYIVGDNAVTLKATISDYDERTEIDEGFESTYYDTFVSYEFEGIAYERVRYDSQSKVPKLGTIVTIKIDPNHPGELLPDAAEYGLSLILSPIFLSIISLFAYITIRDLFLKRIQTQEYEREIRIQNAKLYSFLTIAGLMFIGSWLYHRAVGTWVYLGFCIIAYGLMCLYLYLHQRKKQPTN